MPTPVGDVLVTARSVRHTWQTNPTALRAEIGGKGICYTGDGEFGEEMALAARRAPICWWRSATSTEKPVRWHLNYPDVVAHREDFEAKRIILTHMSREMLAHADEVPEECAYDGMVVEI